MRGYAAGDWPEKAKPLTFPSLPDGPLPLPMGEENYPQMLRAVSATS